MLLLFGLEHAPREGLVSVRVTLLTSSRTWCANGSSPVCSSNDIHATSLMNCDFRLAPETYYARPFLFGPLGILRRASLGMTALNVASSSASKRQEDL